MGNQDFGRQTDNARADILRSKAQIVGAEQTDVLVQPKTIASLVSTRAAWQNTSNTTVLERTPTNPARKRNLRNWDTEGMKARSPGSMSGKVNVLSSSSICSSSVRSRISISTSCLSYKLRPYSSSVSRKFWVWETQGVKLSWPWILTAHHSSGIHLAIVASLARKF